MKIEEHENAYEEHKRNELIAYAMDFASYLISKIGVNRIILHGSVARDDFDEESDIDLFVDIEDKKSDKIVDKILEDYYRTKKFKEWELKGINNPISIITGGLDDDEWKNLKRAIMNTGIILYGKYKSDSDKVNHYTLFSFENIKPDKKRISVFRKLFGFKIGKKRYPGLIEKRGAVRIGKGNILVPVEYANEIRNYFQEKRIRVKLFDFWSDEKIT